MSREKQPGGGEIELLPRIHEPAQRRDFLKWSGAGALALVGLAACGDDTDVRTITEVVPGPPTPPPPAPPPPTAPAAVTLNFANVFGVLNYAFALEQLEAAFYVQVVNSPGFNTIFSANERQVLLDVRDHELAHREFFARAIPALGGTAIGGLTPNFGSINFGSRESVLTTARTFEDLGVAAYNGAGPLLNDDATGRTVLTVAGKIVSVEARHASAIRDLLAPRSSAFAPSAFDDALPPSQVIAAAQPFVQNQITVTNVPNR
ncbi:MAG TPA: ferritin-like domain-containing protein [Longimicrobium sp.]|jgi:hypothetical protein